MNYNFAFKDFIKSSTATKYGLNNMPTDQQVIQNWFDLVVYCLQPIRDYLGKPMIESSGYRSKAVNAKVGGVANSQHLTGCALDFNVKGMTVNQVIEAIKKSGIEYDQLINEYNKWVHISFVKGKNRKQIFKIS